MYWACLVSSFFSAILEASTFVPCLPLFRRLYPWAHFSVLILPRSSLACSTSFLKSPLGWHRWVIVLCLRLLLSWGPLFSMVPLTAFCLEYALSWPRLSFGRIPPSQYGAVLPYPLPRNFFLHVVFVSFPLCPFHDSPLPSRFLCGPYAFLSASGVFFSHGSLCHCASLKILCFLLIFLDFSPRVFVARSLAVSPPVSGSSSLVM